MEVLNNLISKLNKQEVSLVRSYLEHFNLKEKGDKVLLSFFDFLIKNAAKAPDANECSQYLYGKRSDGKFRMIKSKLRSRVLDALILDKSIDTNKVFDVVSASSLKTRKRALNLNYLFFSKGGIPITTELIEEILAKGIKFENYSSMLEALRFKKYLKAFSKGIKEFNEINKLIAHYEYCDQAKSRAADHYYKLITRSDFHSQWNTEIKQKYLQEAILELKKDYKYTHSGLVAYYLKLLEISYFQNRDDHAAARNSCVELLSVIREYPSVYKKLRVAIAFDSIGECDVFLGNYTKAISNFHSAQNIFLISSAKNYLISKEFEFKTLLYDKNIPASEKALNEIADHPDINLMGDFRQSKYSFYKANILFKKEKYSEALREISQYQEISKDKTGWEIAIRVLAIMCAVEMKQDDRAATLIENLVQHIKRNKKEGQSISVRDEQIVRILQALSKNGFMFRTLNDKTMRILVAVSGHEKKYNWQPLGPELIPFHEWMGSKLNKKKEQVTTVITGSRQLAVKN